MIGRVGLAGVSQRVVAAEAGVPASAVTYYFPAVEDLLLAVMVDVNDGYVAALRECRARPDPLTALAELIAAAGAEVHRSRSAAEVELFLLAAQGPPWRAEYERWTAALVELFAEHTDDPTLAAALAAAVDGLLLRSLCLPHPGDAERVRESLESLVDRADHRGPGRGTRSGRDPVPGRGREHSDRSIMDRPRGRANQERR